MNPPLNVTVEGARDVLNVYVSNARGVGGGGASGETLAAIAATIAKTAVDLVAYDTSLDSDPLWRERSQQTSWYNETLDTATRGATRKHPALAVAILEAGTLTIYDATDASVPMWRVDNLPPFTYKSVTAKDGKYLITTESGLIVLDYALDNLDTSIVYSTATTPAIVNNAVNHATITVRRDAALNAITDLPEPTIALATDGGLSVVNSDGTITDSAETGEISNVTAVENGFWYSRSSALFYTTYEDAEADGFGDRFATTFEGVDDFDLLAPAQLLAATSGGIAIGSSIASTDGVAGLMLHKPDYTDQTKGMSALITSGFNTGWLQGDIEVALCDGLTDRSVTGTTITDNGTAVISEVATGSEQKKITATGGSITAPVTTGGAIYGWEYIAGVPVFRAGTGWVGVSEAAGTLTIADGTAFAMLRYTNGSGPSATQYVYQEESEKHILQADSDCLLYGTSDAVTALDADPVTDLLHAGTSNGRSGIQGLRRVNNTTNAVGAAISASNGLIADE